MKKIYTIEHIYDVDIGFGDAVTKSDVLFITDNKQLAEEFVEKYSNPHIYDISYTELYAGTLNIEEHYIITSMKDLPQNVIEWGNKNITQTDVKAGW